MLPLLWLSLFALAPELRFYLVPAIISAVGLLLPHRRYFFGPEQRPARVR
jgi:hypothetical protein